MLNPEGAKQLHSPHPSGGQDRFRAIFDFTERLLRADCLQDIYDAGLDAILTALNCSRASILLFDNAGVMRFVAWHGLSDPYRQAVEGHSPWQPDDVAALPIWIDNVEAADLPLALKATVRAEGIAAVGFIPLLGEGRVIGKFMAYRDEPRPFTEQEAELAVTIARQLGFGLERESAEQARHAAENALRRQEAQLRFVTDHVPLMIVHCDRGARFRFVNGPYASRFGLQPRQIVGRTIADVVGAEAYERFRHYVEAALAGEQVEYEMSIPYEQLGPRRMHCVYVPQMDSGGRTIGFVAVIQDVTEKRESEARFHESERRLELALQAGKMGAWEWDINTGDVIWSPGLEAIHGLEPGTFQGNFEAFQSDILPDDLGSVLAEVRKAVESGEPYHVSYSIVRPDGAIRWLEAFGRPIGADGEVRKMSGVCMDITERKNAESQRDLLVAELNHRVKNTLATVQSLALQTLRNTERSADARELFDARLAALSRTHDVLTNQSLEGADLREIVARALEPFQAEARRISVEGSALHLSARQALALSMALHELATNAAKYGALSSESGTVQLVWTVLAEGGQRKLQLLWAEAGGPAVHPPARKGFGSRLIERGLASELNGDVTLEFLLEGVVCTICFPVQPEWREF
jgi:PAS domain S-box-containing protein